MKKHILLGSLLLLISNMAIAGGAHVMDEHNNGMKNMSKMDHSSQQTPTRTINVAASDMMRFTPENWNIKSDEVIKFVVTNTGNMEHEFVIGNLSEMREHAQMMKAMPGMKHDEANAVSLAPGEVKNVIFSFNNSGAFQAACNIPGHFEAGMKVNFNI